MLDSHLTASTAESNGTPSAQHSSSYISHWSPAETPLHHHQGTSYFPSPNHPVSPTPRRPSYTPLGRTMSASAGKQNTRSDSLSSSRAAVRAYRESLGEDDQEDVVPPEDDVRHRQGKARATVEDDPEDEGVGSDREEDDPITVKDRQSLINVEHPFGLRIWKPALYKKSRSVTRYADAALHSVPSAQAERHLLPGNIFWVLCFGWWLAASSFIISALLYVIPQGGRRYSTLVFGLGWYLAWPFGKYVEGDSQALSPPQDEESHPRESEHGESGADSGVPPSRNATIIADTVEQQQSHSVFWEPRQPPNENTSLLAIAHDGTVTLPSKSYGATPLSSNTTSSDRTVVVDAQSDWLGRTCFWIGFTLIIMPLMLVTCIACWGLIFILPMAKLNWALIKYIFTGPTNLRFCAAPPAVVVTSLRPHSSPDHTADENDELSHRPEISVKHPRLSEGQIAPSPYGTSNSTILLCTYRAVGWQYYKYTVGGVNIIFVNLLPLVIFVIFDGFVLLPLVDSRVNAGKHVPAFLIFIASRTLIFIMSLASVIPLSYFIGMAVASISAQSSIGMGAVINATFGTVIEVILYAIALTQGKGHLVEGSIVGSLLAGVLLMPGISMCSGALKKKEQKFNAKSAGVTSMMLIMAFIGTLTPTLFYQTYGNFQLICTGCPEPYSKVDPLSAPWKCDQCYYQHPDPVDDPFYQSTVKSLMYFCATILLFSYLIGLWFSLRTHASQIWQNPQQLLQPFDLQTQPRISLYHRPSVAVAGPSFANRQDGRPPRQKSSNATGSGSEAPSRCQTPVPRSAESSGHLVSSYDRRALSTPTQDPRGSPSFARRVSYAPLPLNPNFNPVLDDVNLAIQNSGFQELPGSLATDDFTRAVAVATVNALRHQQTHSHSPARIRASGVIDGEGDSHGGHEGPSWSRTTSAAVLLACTALYAIIAELLIDVVDVVLQGSGIDEKFLGITLFALVPNTTEFMNAISFAMNGNIALSMEIGSAYALQVCLLQIPAMVAFSAWYAPDKMGEVASTFTLIFPRWDVVVIILSVFLLTYTYIEAKSNYHRGSILILSYLVLASGFYFAPEWAPGQDELISYPNTIVRWISS